MPTVAGPVIRFWRHLRSLWPGWTIALPLPFLVQAVLSARGGHFRWDTQVGAGLATALFVIGPQTKRLFLGLYPLGLVGLLYGAMKAVQGVGVSPQTVHVCDLRNLERLLFGIVVNGERVTVHDWLRPRDVLALDLLCAVPYSTFLFVVVGCATWLYFRDYKAMQRFSWCFFALSVAGFITYHLCPVAPPWYYHLYGCHVDTHVTASAGPNLERVDAWLGVHYFAGMYARSSSVFGAMPSLHVAYALLVALEGWASFNNFARAFSVAFFVLMSFSAVYLDHHWIVDVVAGSVYCVAVVAAARKLASEPQRGVPLHQGEPRATNAAKSSNGAVGGS